MAALGIAGGGAAWASPPTGASNVEVTDTNLGDSRENVTTLARRLIAWIAEHSQYAAPEPPRIVFENERALAMRFYGESYKSDSPLRVEALYEHATETVFLCDCWHASDMLDQSRLLHELVHYVQRRNKAQSPCSAALEIEPYALQATWLSEQGVKRPYEAIGTDRFTIDVLSSCGN